MSFRSIYIIKPSVSFPDCVLYHRKFPIIERKCKKKQGENYVAIPPNFPVMMVETLQLKSQNEFDPDLDSCARKHTTPIYKLLKGTLSPVVSFFKFGFIYSCIPFDDNARVDGDDILHSPGVSLAFYLLQNMSKFIGHGNTTEVLQRKMEQLHQYASIGFPHGIPSELDIETALGIASYVENIPLPKIKGPSWRPTTFKGKQIMHVEIEECISAIQFDCKDYSDICEINGIVKCKADVEESPEISFDISAPLDSMVHNQMLFHPCVQLTDSVTPILAKSGDQFGSRKLRFFPPTNQFNLCQYKLTLPEDNMPVKAFYQMKGDDNKITVMVQVQVSEHMKNTFENFEIVIPFFNRGPITEFKALTSSNLVLLTDKCTLLWNVGQKFSTKGGDKIMEANISFDRSPGVPHVRQDPFLIGVNSYIMMHWRATDFTYSGLKFENKSVELFPNSKIKVNSGSTLKTVEYKVWNSQGNITQTTFSQSSA